MRNFLLSVFIVLFTGISFAGDILTLTNQMTFEGKVIKIKPCEVIFKAAGEKFTIPSEDIFSIQFESVTDKSYVDYVKMIETDPDLCYKGYNDADMYHGKGSLHFALGFLFGPFAMIGTAIARPEPVSGIRTYRLSENKDVFYDPSYLKCYRKKAKSNNLVMEGIGWGVWVFIVLIAGA